MKEEMVDSAAIVEQVAAIGFDVDGQLRIRCEPGTNPAMVSIMLEQLRLSMIHRMRFEPSRKVATVLAMPGLNGRKI